MFRKMNNGNNIPVQSPLFPSPFVPYQCKNNKSLSAYCKVNKEMIIKLLEPTPFEYVSDVIVISITDFTNCDKISFMDCGIVLPVKYKDRYGGYYLFEYENQDSAIAAGRELWGYPKKYANISLKEDGNKIYGEVIKDGVSMIKVLFEKEDSASSIPAIKTTPHLNMHIVPKPDGPGILLKRIIERDTSPDFITHEKTYGKALLELNGTNTEIIDLFKGTQVLGASYVIGDFYATEENGWGKVLDVITNNIKT